MTRGVAAQNGYKPIRAAIAEPRVAAPHSGVTRCVSKPKFSVSEEGIGVRSRYGKLVALLLAVAMLATLAVGCAKKEETPADSGAPTSDVKTAMVTDIGGLGDKSFNDGSYLGLQNAEKDFGVTIKVLESKEAVDYEPNISQLASAGYNPIFAVGFLMQDTVSKMATAFPDVTFAAIDCFFDPTISNVVGLNFKEQEAAYLAGVLAGSLTTLTDADPRINDKLTVGFVGGMEIPPVQRFLAGFKAGVAKANPNVNVLVNYTGTFTDQQKGKEAALAMIEQGADIVFAAAGSTGVGSFTACQEKNALFIGVDVDQYNTLTNPGDTIVTSAIKRVDIATYATVKAAVEGKLTGGDNKLYGLADDGVGLAPYHDWDSKLPQAVKDAVEAAKTEVVAGTVVVPSE
jgi:basic membrane protein A